MAFKPRVVKDDDPAPDYDPDIVDCLREALRRAEAGDVKSVIVLTEDSEGVYSASICTAEPLPLFTYTRLFAEDETRELMGLTDETRH